MNIKKFEAIKNNIDNPGRILKQIGEMIRSRMQNAFVEQSRGAYKWRERKTPNIMGILSDLELGTRVKKRRFDSRPALVDTGTLLRSFGRGERNIELTKKTRLEVGTPISYAPTLNIGGESSMRITKTMKKNLAKYLKRDRGRAKRSDNLAIQQQSKDRNKQLGWIFKKDEVKTRIPARPFAIITPIDLKDSVAIIKKEFTRKL